MQLLSMTEWTIFFTSHAWTNMSNQCNARNPTTLALPASQPHQVWNFSTIHASRPAGESFERVAERLRLGALDL